jgi:type IV pilus assembly protein PilC
MPLYSYTALDSKGKEKEGTLEGANQNEAITRLKEMGFFPTKVMEIKAAAGKVARGAATGEKKKKSAKDIEIKIPGFGGRVDTKSLCTFTRQLATLVDAGLPLLRGMQVLGKQEKNPALREIVSKVSATIEGGSTFSEALAQHPKVFDKLFINMVKAGELGGVLEVTLNRLSEFMEKAEKIKSKVKAAMFYPVAVLVVAVGIVVLLMIVVVPQFEKIFAEMLSGESMPEFTLIVLGISRAIQNHFIVVGLSLIALYVAFKMTINKTKVGRYWWDWFLLRAPAVGPLITKVAISRFTRTLGTLVASGVPILQALNIVRETAGNVIVANAIIAVYDSVKEGASITRPLEASGIFPPMVISMVDVGEQTGALPEMLVRISNNYDEEVDNAVGALTSLIEPIMIVFLAVVVGSIVIAMFMPLIKMMDKMGSD